jgi:hypothetical protein
MLQNFKISLELNFIQNQGPEQNFLKRQGFWCKILGFFCDLDLFSYEKWRGPGAGL